MRIPLTPHGWFELLLFGAVFGGGAWLGFSQVAAPLGPVLGILLLLSLVFCLNFFRDPDRVAEGHAETLIAPADGKVTDILRIEKAPFVVGPSMRIGIFLSVFDVHVNRVPVAGEVGHLEHVPGAFLDARDPACADENERQDLGLWVQDGQGERFPILVRQVAGLIARRIICKAKMGQSLARGERYGMIKFGSRTEVYVPVDRMGEIAVKVGDRVKGGKTALATLQLRVPSAEAKVS